MKILKTGFPFTFQEFRRLERLSQSIEKISNKNINKIQEISDIGINSLSFADLSIIQFHSNKKISKKAAKLALQINPQSKNNDAQEIQMKNWRIHYFKVFFLASSDFKSYFQALKVIRKNFADYEPYLIGLLFHEESVLGLNASRVLHKYCIKNYPTSDNLDIICSLSHEIKKQWFGYLYQHNTQFLQDKSSWDKREEFILKIGALGFPEGVNILKQYQNDSDFNCRLAVAKALRNILSKSSIKLLYLLLFDQEPSVHSEAVKSLSILFPDLYKNKNAQGILDTFESYELIRFLSEVQNFEISKRIWTKRNYDYELIKEFLEESIDSIIEKYRIEIETPSNNIKLKMKRYETLILLLINRMPLSMEKLKTYVDNSVSETKRDVYNQIYEKLQSNLQIETEQGFSILL